MKAEFESLFQLSRAERIQLVEDLWDSLVIEEHEDTPVSQAKVDELYRRKAEFEKDPSSGITWEEVKKRVVNG